MLTMPDRSDTESCSFERWGDANKAPRTILKVSDSKYFCAPQCVNANGP
jgi:hypothetical protein